MHISVFQGLIIFMSLLDVSVFLVVALCHRFQRYSLTENLCNCRSMGQMFIFPQCQPTSRTYTCLGEELLISKSDSGSCHPTVVLLRQVMGEDLSSCSNPLGSRQPCWLAPRLPLGPLTVFAFCSDNYPALVALLSYWSCTVTQPSWLVSGWETGAG